MAPESIPWLVNNGGEKEAEELIRKALAGTDTEIPPKIFPVANNEKQDGVHEKKGITCKSILYGLSARCRKDTSRKKAYTVKDIFRRSRLRKNAAIMALVW